MEEARRGHAKQVGSDGHEVRENFPPVAGDQRDAEKNDIAGHRVGEDMAVGEIDDGVGKASDGGEEESLG